MSVTFEYILAALRALGICEGDTVLTHSSMKSLGWVEGGPETVIAAFRAAVGETGTFAVPTLIQKDFRNSYETWHIDKPSDVGLLTEVFRKMPGALRSDQATHSVAAIGARARELTENHGAYGKRVGAFGDTPFAEASPWQRLRDWNAKIVLVGVDFTKNTMKHLVEYRIVNEALDRIADPDRRAAQIARLRGVKNYDNPALLWPWLDSAQMQTAVEQAGLVSRARCGSAEFLCFPAGDACELWHREIKAHSEQWLSPEMLEWFENC